MRGSSRMYRPQRQILLCREGEEVTICYGPWPDDVFALFYGFLPREPTAAAGQPDGGNGGGDAMPNPHDKVSLFADLPHVAEFVVEQFGPRESEAGQREAWKLEVADELAAALGGNCQRCGCAVAAAQHLVPSSD